MKNIGIWIDKEKAHIVVCTEQGEKFSTLQSNVEFYNPKGGSRSKTRWGPQDVVQDSKYLEREKQQLKVYFKNLVKMVTDADALAIFGPAEAAEKFEKELLEKYPQLASKIKTVTRSDSMTNNQVKALVRDFFNKDYI
jgi:stalled ribosome rescue protein Dom34